MKLHLWSKLYNHTQNRAKSVSYTSSPFSPYLGALEIQFALGPFYIFVALSLMVLYQLESINMDDSNLIYSKNKNMGFTKILTAIPLKTQHSPLFFTTNPQNHNTSIINMKVIQNHSITLVLVVWNSILQSPIPLLPLPYSSLLSKT